MGAVPENEVTLVDNFLRTRPFALVGDAPALKLSFADRHSVGKRLAATTPQIGPRYLANAIVVQSLAVRGEFRAIMWTAPPPVPVRFFNALEDAKEWARSCRVAA